MSLDVSQKCQGTNFRNFTVALLRLLYVPLVSGAGLAPASTAYKARMRILMTVHIIVALLVELPKIFMPCIVHCKTHGYPKRFRLQVAWGWNRTNDFELMRLARCHCVTPHQATLFMESYHDGWITFTLGKSR